MKKRTTFKIDQPLLNNIGLVGVSCSLKDYKFVWFLNNQLSLDFKRLDDFCFYSQQNKTNESFPLYYYNDEINLLEWFCWVNKKENQYAVSNFNQIDFFILIKGFFDEMQIKQLIKNIKQLPIIVSAFNINFTKIKDFDLLLQDLEIYIIELNKKEKLEKNGNFRKKTNRFIVR